MAPNTGQPAFLIFKWVSFLLSVTGFYKTCVHLGPEYICSTKILHERAILKCFHLCKSHWESYFLLQAL